MNRTILAAGAILLLALPLAVARDMDPGAGNNGVSNPGGGYSRGSNAKDDVPLGDLKKHEAYGIAKREGWKLAPGAYRYTPVTEPDKGNPGRVDNSALGRSDDKSDFGRTGSFGGKVK